MIDSKLVEDRIRRFVAVADDSDWQDVVRRAGVDRPARSTGVRSRLPSRWLRIRRRRVLVVLGLVASVAVPAAAFADDIGTLLGLSNHGNPVATSALSKDSSLVDAMRQFGFPSTLRLLGTRDGLSFYAAQKPHGYCLAIVESATPAGAQRPAADVGCENGPNGFPSPREPVSVFPVGGRFAGFAADGVASVALVDASGARLATAEVSQNLFVAGAMPTGPVTVIALDPNGEVIAKVLTQRATAGAGDKLHR
jgi:hypothetical protein